jgi:hypothetical protein
LIIFIFVFIFVFMRGALSLSFDCGLEISNYMSPLDDDVCCYERNLAFTSPLTLADPVLCCFFFTLVIVNFHSPGDVQLDKSSSISSSQVLVLLSTKTVSDLT